MKSMHSSRLYPEAGAPRNAWTRFWFKPTDPTTLGFMRIVTGLLVIYVHLAYCFDFQAFFGPHGWWDQEAANHERTESPWVLQNWGWDPYKQPIQTPVLTDRRAAVFDFLKHLPEDKNERDAVLGYLYRVLEQRGGDNSVPENNYRQGLLLLQASASLTDEQREQMAAELGKQNLDIKKAPIAVPGLLLELPPAERVQLWKDSQLLLSFMPNPSTVNFIYVLEWLSELNPQERTDLADFFRKLPDGPESKRILAYYDTWRHDPRAVYSHGRNVFSLWFHLSNPTSMWVCHFLILFIFVLFTIGFCTRVTSVMSWLGAVFYIHRTQQVLFGMDTMMNILLFYLMIGPSGAALSVDRLIARYRAARALFKSGGQPAPWAEATLCGPQPSALANFTMRLFQVHFCFIYLASGLSKLKGTAWWNTVAAWDIIANPEFCPINYSAYQWILFEIANRRPLLSICFMGTVYFTLFMEIGLPFLIWTRLRPIVLMGAVFLHTGIAWIMGLTCFGLLMMTLLLCYVPASVIRERLLWSRGTGMRLTLRFSSRNPSQARLVGFLHAFDVTDQIVYQDEGPKNSDVPVQFTGIDGKAQTGNSLYEYAWQKLTLMRALAWVRWVPGVSAVLRFYLGISKEGSNGNKASPILPGLAKSSTLR